ncbi:hypothetical protein CHS0354_015979 [Potamilus streckersoni]|uniref:Uncharacterized protein n=1 Tax=Potamilus streckersoni TaxID=2493646 RepID=A0AAE0VVZ2_9BIVA|nr:hypothetical protein CHS0354_015979 [Potamilus streckersoni]
MCFMYVISYSVRQNHIKFYLSSQTHCECDIPQKESSHFLTFTIGSDHVHFFDQIKTNFSFASLQTARIIGMVVIYSEWPKSDHFSFTATVMMHGTMFFFF